MKHILITGATGFFGQSLVKELSQYSCRLYLLVRKSSLKKAQAMFESNPHVELVEGDILESEVIVQTEDQKKLFPVVTDVIHCAALYDLVASYSDLYQANVLGTHNLIHVASQFKVLKTFHHISTMAVAGDHSGAFSEDSFDESQNFDDSYAQTKFVSELIVREWKTQVSKNIYRLGILVGDSETGHIPKVDGLYYLLKSLKQHKKIIKPLPFVVLPINKETSLPVLAVNIASRMLSMIVDKENTKRENQIETYHVMGEAGGVKVTQVVQDMFRYLGYSSKVKYMTVSSQLPLGWVLKQVNIPKQTLHYLNSQCRYQTEKTNQYLSDMIVPSFSTYSDQLYQYATQKLFSQEKRA